MRIALVSPYSWTYPGGVTRHIEALAVHLQAAGHGVRVFAPYDPDDARAARSHGGARPQAREAPSWLTGLGRTVGFPANGAISNLAITPYAVATLRRELSAGGFDVVHVHEPVAPIVGWDALCSTQAPLVGTFHCYSTNRFSNGAANLLGARRRLNRLRVRIAVSEAAAWTGQRFFGGRYLVIPNGVEVAPAAQVMAAGPGTAPRAAVSSAGRPLRIVFVGQAVERKGLPVLMRAFEALREHFPVTLTLVGTEPDEAAPLLLDDRGVLALGKVCDAQKARCLKEADVLCAPSLGGESFGMVLTEAFAAGTPVVASDIPGYRDVVGAGGRLVPPGDATALAETLRELALDPAGRRDLGEAAGRRAGRFAWSRVTEEVIGAYEEATTTPSPQGALHRAGVRLGALPADLGPRVPARRLPRLEPQALGGQRPLLGALRRAGLAAAALAAMVLALLALTRIGLDRIAGSLLASSPSWVLLGLALMCASMVLRGLSWYAILRAALPTAEVRRSDALQGTFIGVLMSATLPARLGEPSRALIVARRLGGARQALPVVLGTLVSQTLLNILALALLGILVFSSVNLFDGHHQALVVAALGPLALVASVLLAPAVLGRGTGSSSRVGRLTGLLVQARRSLFRVRAGLRVFANPRLAVTAAGAQLAAWALQCLSCYVLLVALGLHARAGLVAAAAVLFAVNVTAVLPAVPSNLGVFQAACVAVLAGAFHVPAADALAYGIILQAVEIATAVVMGAPALVKEGLSFKEVRLRAIHAAPVRLSAPGRPAGADVIQAEG